MHDHKVMIGVFDKPPESNSGIFLAHFSDLMGMLLQYCMQKNKLLKNIKKIQTLEK